MKRVNRFHVVTELAGLLNKDIQQVDLCLLEVNLANEADDLAVKGIIGRQIQYHEYDGRLRRIADRIQFAIYMGKAVRSPLSSLQTELRQEYFILQSSENEKNNVMLDHGFLIIVHSVKIVDSLPKVNVLRVNSIITRGQDSIIIKIPVHSFLPKTFRGKARFIDYAHFPVIIAEIRGTVCERTQENLLRKSDIRETIGLIVKAPVPKENQHFIIKGIVKEVTHLAGLGKLNEYLILQLDYQWYLTEPRELSCIRCCNESNPPLEKIQTLLRLDGRSFSFLREFMIVLPEFAGEIELNLEYVHFENTMTQKGLLLNVILTWGLIFINSNGVEQYQELQSRFDELFPYYFSGHQQLDHTWTTDLQVKLKKHARVGNKLAVTIECQYQINTFQKQIIAIVEDNTSSEWIYAKIPFGKVAFSVMAEERFDLKYLPLQVVRVASKLLDIYGESERGGFIINGHLEINITYIDREHIIREGVFQSFFQEFYVWDKLSDHTEIQIHGNINYENCVLSDTGIVYYYLASILVEAFNEKAIPIKTASDSFSATSHDAAIPNDGSCRHHPIESLLLEDEISLKQGNAKEIAANHVMVTQFNCKNSHNALLVSGNLSGELEYWDQNQYLQKVMINLPFWRFVHRDFMPRWEPFKLLPRIKDCIFTPLHSKPWQKGIIKVRYSVELCQTKEDANI